MTSTIETRVSYSAYSRIANCVNSNIEDGELDREYYKHIPETDCLAPTTPIPLSRALFNGGSPYIVISSTGQALSMESDGLKVLMKYAKEFTPKIRRWDDKAVFFLNVDGVDLKYAAEANPIYLAFKELVSMGYAPSFDYGGRFKVTDNVGYEVSAKLSYGTDDPEYVFPHSYAYSVSPVLDAIAPGYDDNGFSSDKEPSDEEVDLAIKVMAIFSFWDYSYKNLYQDSNNDLWLVSDLTSDEVMNEYGFDLPVAIRGDELLAV